MAEKKPLGVLILHGFTGTLDTVRSLVPMVEGLGLPYRMPLLAGHGTRVEDLAGVGPEQWYADAEAALTDLLTEVDQAIIVGLSMGGLLTLNLAMAHGDELAGIVVAGTFLRCADPLTPLTPVLAALFPYWKSPNSFNDAELAKGCTNYPKFPTRTFQKLLRYGAETEKRLGSVMVPALILHARKDTIAHPISANILAEKLGSTRKRVVWFERSGHEMFQDLESEAIVAAVRDYLASCQTAKAS